MTTDIVSKAASATCTLSGKTVRMSSISKSASIIRPNMATIFGFIATDANMDDVVSQGLVYHAASHSFNNVTVDGGTSISGLLVVIVTDRADTPRINSESHPDYAALCDALTSLAQKLAQKIMRDSEGAMKFMTIQVEGDRNVERCRLITYTVAYSPLVKTAFYVSDPNLGCILAAVGYAGVTDPDVNGVNLQLGDVWVARDGGCNPDYREEDGQRAMEQAEITVHVALGRGDTSTTAWTCDFSHDYTLINAGCRS